MDSEVKIFLQKIFEEDLYRLTLIGEEKVARPGCDVVPTKATGFYQRDPQSWDGPAERQA